MVFGRLKETGIRLNPDKCRLVQQRTPFLGHVLTPNSLETELLGLKWAVCEKFRGYLWGANFTVFTDNNPLRHLPSAKLGATEQRLVAELAAYNFSVKYRPAKENKNADALSRHPVRMPDPEDPETQWAAVTCVQPTTEVPRLPVTASATIANQQVLPDQDADIRRLQDEDKDLSAVRGIVDAGLHLRFRRGGSCHSSASDSCGTFKVAHQRLTLVSCHPAPRRRNATGHPPTLCSRTSYAIEPRVKKSPGTRKDSCPAPGTLFLAWYVRRCIQSLPELSSMSSCKGPN